MNNIAKSENKRFERSFSFDRASVDQESRTVTLAFSSEDPYERFFGWEILDHGQGSIRLGRLMDGAPLLLDHNIAKQIGVVEKVEIGPDRVGRAVVRFGRGEFAEEIFQDVMDGIRRKVSVGYMIHKMVLDRKDGDQEYYRVTDWEPLEVSLVAIPADNTVGVGRAIEESKPLEREVKMDKEQVIVQPDVKSLTDEIQKKERARIADLIAVGAKYKQWGGEQLAQQFVAEGRSVDQLQICILERAGEIKPVDTRKAEIGLSENEIRQFSFVRALNALSNPQDIRAQEAASYEREVSEAAAKKAGKQPQGIFVPHEVLNAPSMQKRDLLAGVGNLGGYTIQTELRPESFIEVLRRRMVVNALGAQTLSGLTGNIAIPRQTGAATAFWLGENVNAGESQQAFDQVTMQPKTVGGLTEYSRKLLIQSSMDVENFIRNDLTQVLALEIDRAALYGIGAAGQPLGLRNTTGVLTSDFAAATPTFAEVVGLETLVAAQNADTGTLAYATNATLRGAFKTAPKFGTGTEATIWEPGNTVNGYRIEISNQIIAGDVWFGNWSDLLLGFWSGLDLMVDPYSGSAAGVVRVTAFQDMDVAARRVVSFARGNDNLAANPNGT
jgi:HK97 family phage major capsid protein